MLRLSACSIQSHAHEPRLPFATGVAAGLGLPANPNPNLTLTQVWLPGSACLRYLCAAKLATVEARPTRVATPTLTLTLTLPSP